MNFFAREKARQQTQWGMIGDRHTWFAYIDAPITDLAIIEDAKWIVDHCAPQRYGPHGTHAYSFLKREYLLNLLLFHYADHGFFPAGHICITDEWLYQSPIQTTGGSWYSFKCRKAGRNYQAGWWIKIPRLEEIPKPSSSYEPQAH